MSTVNRSTVTVAIVVRDRRVQMGRCLDALAALNPHPDALLVVDNGSTDGTVELLRSRGVPMLEVPGPLGAARQAAVEACTTDLLAFTDSDCRPRPDWIGALLAARAPGDVVVQGRTVPAEASTARWAATQDIAEFSQLYETCNLLYDVSALRAAGGFDSSDGFFGEDTSAGWRVRRLGRGGRFAPDAVVEHDVTYPGMAWHLRRGLGYAAWPALVRQFPEMRTDLLYRRVFLRPRSLPVVAAALGGLYALLRRRPAGLVAALPWLIRSRPDRGGLAGLADAAAGMSFDAAVLAGLVTGSVRERCVVL